ncbi:hypothetical protein [Streptomyces sp. NPDC001401]|uniref:hypothetical protein n=1 Tax=Streptomyces sp. NPDC001401 TaxID=3364570 RepID=UPI0036C42760
MTTLQGRPLLRKLRCSTGRSTDVVRAVLSLELTAWRLHHFGRVDHTLIKLS